MRSAEEWAKECQDKGHGPLGQFTLVRPVICLNCARAYAREVGEAVVEAAEIMAKQDRSAGRSDARW